ncbi:XkdF-like putative serine protease domain-containing protein [Haloarcula argentinensis]|uniref:Phage-like element PBSX protein XkdF domain-containing protein n=1 Tax=Haloarcula argentinensis TaxID=43776 RepID=A0A847UJR8_HALAR|nr:XkdF-like putative serine protease domain-containing protein [Haloarcula argentinensis]NLV11890.1 hypothetical protein [Haloarcula argentinensis]
MPPVSKAGGDAFRKEVAFVDKDEEEQRAAGIVMVPDKVDLQQDFVREETIEAFADEFAALYDSGSADGGIMHAAWPSDWMSLERNEVLDEAEEIGGQTVEAGAWVQEWEVADAGTWELVKDGVYGGYSIGAKAVEWDGPYIAGEDDAVEDVAVPDQLPDDAMVWELTDGVIREVSAVDIPAVPDAEILETKRLGDHLGDRDAFIEEAIERGHSEDDAERMWDNLSRALEEEGAGDPGKQSRLQQAAKSFVRTLTGGDGDDNSSTETPSHASKAGETLSQSNRESAMAAVDANLDMLEDAGVDHDMTRFTDRDDVDFDLSEHDAREWGTATGEDDEDSPPFEVNNGQDAPGGDTPDDSGTEAAASMSSDDDTDTNDKTLAEKNAEQINELSETVEELTAALTGKERTVSVEVDGETHEVPKSRAEELVGDGDAGSQPADTAERVAELEARLDAIKRQSGVGSQQLAGDGEGGDGGDDLDDLGKALS